MSAREAILNRVRKACSQSRTAANGAIQSGAVDLTNEQFDAAADQDWQSLVANFPEEVQSRLKQPVRHTLPDIPPAKTDELTNALIEQMEAVQISVVRLQSMQDVVGAVDWYLQEQNLSGELCVAPELEELNWQSTTCFGPASGATVTSVTGAMLAIAETGSIALASSEQSPSTLNFLPENHIVVLRESHIVRSTEDAWDSLRKMEHIPRALNLVTGPSRTGDIEQTIELGAHGPRRMHVLLVATDH